LNPSGGHGARRATTDDLPRLLALWRDAQFPAGELERQFTDFHVAADARGSVAAAIGLRLSGAEGQLHSETFADFALTDTLRPLLWRHLQVVAQSYGLFRLWTRETAPFWRKEAGFAEATPELLAKLPAAFGAPTPGWLILRIREEGADPESLERQFEMFKIVEREKREKILRRARALRVFGTLLAGLIFLSGVLLLLYFYTHRKR
jgi:N-acetylglutamate synthase-like GNAT family acetyltransferase